MTLHFAMNRTCAPHLPLEGFIALARQACIGAVEIRNDIPGREFADGTLAADLREKLAENGLKLASVNALQRFNDWTPDRRAEAEALIAYAAALGAPGLVLCPVHEEGHGWTEVEAERQLREGLRQLAPILRDHGITGYVEPLGMTHSTMKRQDMAVAAIADTGGWDCYSLCFDTFQYFRCGDSRLFPEHIGLVHVSGITRPDLLPGEMTEPDRGLLFLDDRTDCVGLLKTVLDAGYDGHISMEPFSPTVQQDADLAQRLVASFGYLSALLTPPR